MSNEDRISKATNKKLHDELCKLFESELRRFLSHGETLRKIRELGVYKDTHKTFAAFTQERFGIDRTYAHRLIDAAEVNQNLLPIVNKTELPQTESQYREVAKAPIEKQAEVVKAVAEICQEEQRKPTANDYKKAVDELVYGDVPDDDDDEIIESKASTKPLAVQNAAVVQSIIGLINEAKRELNAVEKAPGLELLCASRLSIERELNDVKASLAVTKPHSICPRCKGKRCVQCGNLGWCNAVLAKELSE